MAFIILIRGEVKCNIKLAIECSCNSEMVEMLWDMN